MNGRLPLADDRVVGGIGNRELQACAVHAGLRRSEVAALLAGDVEPAATSKAACSSPCVLTAVTRPPPTRRGAG